MSSIMTWFLRNIIEWGVPTTGLMLKLKVDSKCSQQLAKSQLQGLVEIQNYIGLKGRKFGNLQVSDFIDYQ